jgi:RNA polymerase sigma factor (sigma-70 family)
MAGDTVFLDLWERARHGDRNAQADLYLEYGPHLRRIIRLKLNDLRIAWAVDTHDVLDSFFIRLCRGGDKITIEDALHFTNYCEKALRHKCHQILRSIIRRSTVRIEDCPPEAFDDPHTDTGFDRMVWAEELDAAYSRLTQRDRTICWLASEGVAWSDIGNRLNISAAAARKAFQRAEERVRGEVLASRKDARERERERERDLAAKKR